MDRVTIFTCRLTDAALKTEDLKVHINCNIGLQYVALRRGRFITRPKILVLSYAA